jgi:hypothetical protein
MKSDSSCVTPLPISAASLPHENREEGRDFRYLNNECMILVLSTCIKVQFRCWQKTVGDGDRKVACTRSMQKQNARSEFINNAVIVSVFILHTVGMTWTKHTHTHTHYFNVSNEIISVSVHKHRLHRHSH